MRTRVFLTPSDATLSGKYPASAEHVHIICDTSVAAFSVVLPDLLLAESREFIFYNLPENNVGNVLTVYPVTGQVIGVSDLSHTLAAFDTVGFVSDLRKRWLLSDINFGGGSPGGTSDHSLLTKLDYASSGHTGFAASGSVVTAHSALSQLDYASSGHTGFVPVNLAMLIQMGA
jgi:hypothetical protein